MGGSEDGKSSSKTEKSSPPLTEQTCGVHMYPDWAAMQAYYGPRVAMPPYFNPAVGSGHPPHPYMWGPPQSMMSPYGPPYAALYAHGGVYTHPGVPLTSPPLGVESAAKSSGTTEQNLNKKLKDFNGLAMSINGNHDSSEGGAHNSRETEDSSDGSNGNTSEAGGQNGKERSREGTPINLGDGKGKVNGVASEKMAGVTIAPANVAGEKVVGPVFSTALELRNPSPVKTMQAEPWVQNDRELKREKRKQSNRESARRSRLRKQAEAEELGVKVQILTAENTSLKSELNKLNENSEKIKLENAALKERLKNTEVRENEVGPTADLLGRVNNSGSVNENEEENEIYENKNSGAKLYPLLSASPRSDPVAAS